MRTGQEEKIDKTGGMASLDGQSRQMVAELKRRGRYRYMRPLDGASSTRVEIDGHEYILLSSNNYLGLSTHPEVVDAAVLAVKKFGAGAGASRLVSGHNRLVQELEEEIADWKGKDRALVFPSGYSVNAGVISALTGVGDFVLSDQMNHASLIDACRLSKAETHVYEHSNPLDIIRKIQKTGGTGSILIVTDGIFSMDGDIAPLREIVSIKKKCGAHMAVDDAHGTGIIGENGSGVAGFCGVADDVDILIGTLSKAVGSQGGFVAAGSDVIERLINTCRPFIFSTGIAPACAASALAAIRIIRRDFEDLSSNLTRNARLMRAGLREIGFDVPADSGIPIIPLILGGDEAALRFSEKLFGKGVFAPAIRPPSVPEGTSRIRISVMATHTEEDIDRALEAFRAAGRATGTI